MSDFSFTHHTTDDALLHCAVARPKDSGTVRIESFAHSGTIDLDWSLGPLAAKMRFTATEARAVAAELLACADAVENQSAHRGGAPVLSLVPVTRDGGKA
ncbi:MAG: hypothetical protein ACN6O3_10010 [Comamonas sp.]